MAKKNEKRTLQVILDELNKVVDSYNELTIMDTARADLAKQAKDLCNEYNELSLLTVYATCAEATLPVKAFVEAFTYVTVSTKDAQHKETDKDGCMRLVFTKSVTEGEKALVLTKFIEWAAEKNLSVTSSKDWKAKMICAREAIKDEWRKFQKAGGDTHSISIKKIKKSLQELFDALIFISTENGNNAVVATGNIAKTAFQFASMADTRAAKTLTMGDVLPDRVWNAILMKSLLAAVEGKELIINFDGEESDNEQEEAADQPKPAAPKKAAAKKSKPAEQTEPATK